MQSSISILKQCEVLEITRQSSTTLWRQVKAGTFSPPIQIGAKATGYIKDEVNAVLTARSIGMSEKELKALVKKLVAQRKERANRLLETIAA